MIPIKTAKQIATMEKAGKILAEVMDLVLEQIVPGITEIELDILAEKLITQRGGECGFKKVPGYKHTICIATNDVVVHGIPTKKKLLEGDIVGIDCGVFLDGFHTDMAETVYVGNTQRMPPAISRFLSFGKEGLLRGINQVKPGNHIGNISKAIQDKVEKEGKYFITRSLIGHGVGRELHEEPEIPGYVAMPIEKTPILKPGMTIAVEVIYIMGTSEVKYSGTDEWTIKSSDGSLGGLFERTVAVVDTGFSVLTER